MVNALILIIMHSPFIILSKRNNLTYSLINDSLFAIHQGISLGGRAK